MLMLCEVNRALFRVIQFSFDSVQFNKRENKGVNVV